MGEVAKLSTADRAKDRNLQRVYKKTLAQKECGDRRAGRRVRHLRSQVPRVYAVPRPRPQLLLPATEQEGAGEGDVLWEVQ